MLQHGCKSTAKGCQVLISWPGDFQYSYYQAGGMSAERYNPTCPSVLNTRLAGSRIGMPGNAT